MSFRNYYDSSSYGRSRDTGRNAVSTDRPTAVTAKYINTTPTYKSSSIPILCTDRSSSRDDTPISAIANRYSSYNKSDKPATKYEKKDYSKLTVPSVSTNRSRDVSPISNSSKYSLARTSRRLSPEQRSTKKFNEKSPESSHAERDKDIPSKTDKSSGYNSLSSYKLYPRTPSYGRPASRIDAKPEITVNRYAIANRLSSSYLRSPPTVKRTSVSPVSHVETPKCDIEKRVPPPITAQEPKKVQKNIQMETNENNVEVKIDNIQDENESVVVITRHTSPTPPGSSVYVRTRRADMAKTVERTITRPKNRPQMFDKEVQSDRMDDPTRSARFANAARATMSNWSTYTPTVTSYTGYAGRYSTQYSNLRENSGGQLYNERSSRSRSIELQPKEADFQACNTYQTDSKEKINTNNCAPESNQKIIATYEESKDDDTSEIIINVNLKLKRAKSPPTVAAAESVSPEVTITNSQLPPQAPKLEGSTKLKKVKVRKSSTDSSSDSSPKKKTVKRRSKSVSSTDSDQGSETNDKVKDSKSISPPKCSPGNSTSSNLQNRKLKHSKSRESASPESSVTLSTQSSISEDDMVTKSKTHDMSRTSADESSLSTDRSGKHQTPSAPKLETGTEEAKSFLIRALAPVTNLFKTKHQDSNENTRWLESSTSESTSKDVSNLITESDKSKSKSNTNNIVASNDDELVQLKAIRHIESGERAWWLDSDSNRVNTASSDNNQKLSSDKNIPRKIRHIESGERAWWMEANSDNKSEAKTSQTNTNDSSDVNIPFKKNTFIEEEKPWWLDNSANVPEGVERLSPPKKLSNESEKSEKYNFFKVRHIESGDQKDWWLTNSENSSNYKPDNQSSISKSNSDQKAFPVRRIMHIESGERPWWLSSEKNIPEGVERLPTPPPRQDSDSSDSEEVEVYVPPSQIPPFPLHLPDDEPLGDRRSPEGLETPKECENYRGRISPYENNHQYRRKSTTSSYQNCTEKYISRYSDIDDILGTSCHIYSPFMDSILARRTGQTPLDDDECEEIDPTQVRIHDSTAQRPVIKKLRCRSEIIDCRDEDQLDDAALQVFKDGDYGPYLDLDSTLAEQEEELEGLQDSRKNGIILRTQLSVRVHAIIEKLLQAQGRELRRSLFTLKQILQEDKDLVHEFVANKGLDCLMQIGNMEDQNFLDYVLRALGQVLLYVDGMHGVMAHNRCIYWLYSLVSSRFRHIVKTALKLLLVFVEYTEKNCLLLIDAINCVDGSNGRKPWYNIMKILQDVDASDTELLIYATTLINRCLNSVPDRDSYYDQVDSLQDQGMDDVIQLYMSKQGTDLDLLRQLQIFEAVLLYEDGDDSGTALKQLDDTIVSSVRRRSLNLRTSDSRKSKKQQMKEKAISSHTPPKNESKIINNIRPQFQSLPSIVDHKENKEVSTSVRRRRDRCARQAHHITQQQELLRNSNGLYKGLFESTSNGVHFTSGRDATSNGVYLTSERDTTSNGVPPTSERDTASNGFYPTSERDTTYNGVHTTSERDTASNGVHLTSERDITSNRVHLTYGRDTKSNGVHTTSGRDTKTNGVHPTFNGSQQTTNGSVVATNGSYPVVNNSEQIDETNVINGEERTYVNRTTKNINLDDVLKNGNQRFTAGLKQRMQNGTLGHSVNAADALALIRQKQSENNVENKDDRGILLHREHSIKDLAQKLTSTVSPTTEEKPIRVADMAGIVSKAKEELAKSQSKEIIKSPTIEIAPKVHEIKVSENDLHWEELKKGCLNKEFHLCDLDFSDLRQDSEDDMYSLPVNSAGVPPPPPPGMFPLIGVPPPPPGMFPSINNKNEVPAPPPKPALFAKLSNDSDSSTIKKNKKTVKLFWKEIQENPLPVTARSKVGGFIWDDLPEINVDTKMLEHLFESKTNDLIIKKLMEPKKNLILEPKRSNAINIAMKKLPTPQTIKAAIMKMDATVIGREGIEKLLTMLPTEEEKIRIQEAQYANPDLPLGSAEQFLLTLASINELSSRLKLWVFKLDFDNSEKEIAEPLMDLKQGIELLKVNKTFRTILSTLRSVGSFLNGNNVKGFRLEYLSKVMEVKDTVHKHPLLHHVCEMIIEKFPDTSDLFSEVGPVIRASKVDFDILSVNLQKLESDCKASWDHMKRVAKHDGSQIFKTKINEFITDAAQRIILLSIIKNRVMSRYSKFLLYLGVPAADIHKTRPSDFLKIIAEFALEYRTTRERVLQQLEKKANHRERNKTRGKMIIDMANYTMKNGDHTADNALKELLKTDTDTNSLKDTRRKSQPPSVNKRMIVNGDLSADDEIIESLVKSATSKPRSIPRERRRNRLSDKKNLNRTLDGTT